MTIASDISHTERLSELGRRPRWLRPLLVVLGVPNVIAGGWAIVDPQGWFDRFPGWAPRLVASAPPYNEHLSTDAGAGLLAIGLLALLAAWQPRPDVVTTAMVGYLAFALPHATYHLLHPSDLLTTSQDTVNDLTLFTAVLGALLVLWAALPLRRPLENEA